MAENPLDGLVMKINVETKEWKGPSVSCCALCRKPMVYPEGFPTTDDGNVPLILTYIEKAYIDEYKYFCSYECFENWIDKFVFNTFKE